MYSGLRCPWASTQRAKRALRGRLHPALPVEGATQAPMVEEPNEGKLV
ncbi:MAG: hypothetical protein HZA13_04355 [Nitrospirae bacterium]|nr:hypothetical protein [Nitrospirota bacterium]